MHKYVDRTVAIDSVVMLPELFILSVLLKSSELIICFDSFGRIFGPM